MHRELTPELVERDLRKLVPRANQFGEMDCHELLQDLRRFGVTTRAHLRRLYLRHRKAVLRIDRAPFDEPNAKIQRQELGESRFALLQRHRMFYNAAGLLRLALELEHGDAFNQYVLERYHGDEGGTRSNTSLERTRER